MALRSPQPLIEKTNTIFREEGVEIKRSRRVWRTASPPSVRQFSGKCVSLDVSQSCGFPQPVNRDSFTFYSCTLAYEAVLNFNHAETCYSLHFLITFLVASFTIYYQNDKTTNDETR
jgi:hypothetical protein